MERTVILYHGNCSDGFGGAYAAWKKFGDTAEYIPLSRHEDPPVEAVRGAVAYFIDFTYTKEVMDQFANSAKRVIILDHHEGVAEVITSFPGHVYDPEHSGAVIAWNYFHPGTPIPDLLRYVEEGDLYRFSTPDIRSLLMYIYTKPREFTVWDQLQKEISEQRAQIVERGGNYAEYGSILVGQMMERAKLVEFEGYRCYLGLSASFFTSEVGNGLATKLSPLALVANATAKGFQVSLRRAKGETVDLAKIAQKYGGNGHPFAAAFFLPWGTPLPWKVIENEDTRD